MHRPITLINLFFLLSLLIWPSKSRAEMAYSDEMVRAGVIFGILRFTDWPDFRESDNLEVCTYGESPSGLALTSIASLPSIGKKPVNVQKNVSDTQLSDCHVVVVGKGKVLSRNLDYSILTICDECDELSEENSIIRLMLMDNRVKFAVNLDRVKEQKIRLSASLIELAASCNSSDPSVRGCND